MTSHTPPPLPPRPSLAAQAYHEAVGLFENQYTEDDSRRRWLDSGNSLEQVQAAVKLAQAHYEAQPQSKARKSLTKFSSGLVYYSRILELLAQHDTAIAWGTMKLMLILVLNYEELVIELAKALATISDVLPKLEIHIELFPTDSIRASAEGLFEHIASFYVRVLKWYRESRARRATGVVIKPLRIQIEDLTEKIILQSRALESLAFSMAHQEMKSMYIILKDCLVAQKRAEMENGRVAGSVQDLHQYNQHLMAELQQMRRMLISHHTVNSGLLLTTQQNTRDTQVALMIASTTSPLEKPIESLRQCQSFCRRQTHGSAYLDQIWKAQAVKAWSTSADSALMVVIGSIQTRAITRMAGTYMVELVKSTSVPVLWALKGSTQSTTEGSFTELLKYLAMQALQLDTGAVGSKVSTQFNAARVASCATEEDWLFVLQTALSDFSMVYLVIDAEVLGETARSRSELTYWITTMQRIIQEQSRIVLKIVLLSYRKTSMAAAVQTRPKASHTNVLHLDRLMQSSTAQSVSTPSRALRSKSALGFQKMVIRGKQNRTLLPV